MWAPLKSHLLMYNSVTYRVSLLKVSKSRKQFMVSWILQKNERNSLLMAKKILRTVSFVRSLGRIQESINCFWDLLTFSPSQIINLQFQTGFDTFNLTLTLTYACRLDSFRFFSKGGFFPKVRFVFQISQSPKKLFQKTILKFEKVVYWHG